MSQTINPVEPAAPYIGGKRLLAKKIIPIIQSIPHKSYAEPFVGMGGVFLRRTEISKAEIINDFSKDIANFFRILQRHYIPFMEMLKFQLTTRADFERLIETNPETLTDLERAARFLYLQRTSFGGKVASRTFGITYDRSARFDTTKLTSILENIHSRLSSVTIECLPYHEFLTKYNQDDFLFYLGPPYYNCENYYGKDMFDKNDFVRLNAILAGLKGVFILSINDDPAIRSIFQQFYIHDVETKYSVSEKNTVKACELLISNRPLGI